MSVVKGAIAAADGVRQRKKPGPAKGSKHPGQFQKGYDPRRVADPQRVAMRKEINVLCQEHTSKAVDLLVSVMESEKEQTRSRLVAAEMLIAYAWGRPVSREQHISIVQQAEVAKKPEKLTDNDLLAMIQGRFRAEAQTIEGEAETVEPEADQGVGAGNFLEMGKE